MSKLYLSLLCLLFVLTSVGRAVSLHPETFTGYRMPGGSIGGFLDPAFYVGTSYQTQYSEHVHIGGKVIWPYLFDSKTRKTFGFVGLQAQHGTHKNADAQGLMGLRHLWGRYVITGAFLGYGAVLPHAGSGWLHDAFGGLEFYPGMFSLTAIYHYPWVEHNKANPVPGSFHLAPYKDGLYRLHYRTHESRAYRGGEVRAGAEFLPNVDLRVGYFYYTSPDVPELQGPDVTLTYEHIFGHILARAEGLVRYDLREGWSGRVGLWIGLDRTPLRHGGMVGRFGEFPMFAFDIPLRIITRDAVAGLHTPGPITGVGTENGGGEETTPSDPGTPPPTTEPNDPNAGYAFMFVHNETELTEATERSDVDVALVDGEIQLTEPIAWNTKPKMYAGSGISIPIDGVMTVVSFPGTVHHIIAAAGEPLILGTANSRNFQFLHLTVSDQGTLVNYTTPFAMNTRLSEGPSTYGTVTFYRNTVDASGGTSIYANGQSFDKIAHQEWLENTINADLLVFEASGTTAGAEFFVDVFEKNTLTAQSQTTTAEIRNVQFFAQNGEKLHVKELLENKLTNMGFDFVTEKGSSIDVGDVADNTVEGQTFEGYTFRASGESSLTLASLQGNTLTTSMPAGTYTEFHNIFLHATGKSTITVTGSITGNDFFSTTAYVEIRSSSVWKNLADHDGEITFEGPISQNTLKHVDTPTGSRPLAHNQNALLWFRAETGGQIVVKEAISNNTLTSEGYFGGIFFWAHNGETFAAEHPETKIDIQKGIDHLTFQSDSLYGLPGAAGTPINAMWISAEEKLDTPTNANIHVAGVTENNFSFGPWGWGLAVQSMSGPTQGDAVVTVDAVDDNQFTLNYEKDPATGDFINLGGGGFLQWLVYYRDATLTLGSFTNNNFHINGAVGATAVHVHPLRVTAIGGNMIVQNASGNALTSLGPYQYSAKIAIKPDENANGATVNFGATFRTDNPNFLPNAIEEDVEPGGSITW